MQILLELLKIVVCLAILAAVVNYVLTKGIPSSSRFVGARDGANSQWQTRLTADRQPKR